MNSWPSYAMRRFGNQDSPGMFEPRPSANQAGAVAEPKLKHQTTEKVLDLMA